MPVVRELSTKFTFDVDRSGIQRFNQVLGGMKRSIVVIGTLLGTGVGAKAVAKFGANLERARFQAGRFSEEIRTTGKFAKPLQERIDALSKSFKTAAFTESEAFNAFTQFSNVAEDFPTLEGRFGDFFEFAVLANKAGQLKDLPGVFTEMVEALRSGDPTFLEKLPGFSDVAGAKIRKLQEISQGAFFLPVQRRPQFFRLLLDGIEETREELRATAKEATETTAISKFQDALVKLERAAEKLGTVVLKGITPAIDALSELLNLIQADNVDLPVLTKIAEALGLIPSDAKKGEEAVKRLVETFADLGRAALAGIAIGLPFGIPPLLGAALGLAGGVGLKNLQRISEEEDFEGKIFKPGRERANEAIQQFRNIFPPDFFQRGGGDIPLGPSSAPTNPRKRDLGVPEVGKAPLFQPPIVNNSIQINVTGENPREIARIVTEKLRDMIGRASIEFTPVEGVSSVG
jgi:hypothetical protein